VSERDENLLAIAGDGFVVSGFRAVIVRDVAAAGEDWKREAWPKRPDPAFPIEQGIDVAADVTPRAGEAHDREERGFGHANARVRRGELALGLGDIRPALEQIGGQ